jgi:hypothetical protein
MVYLTIDNFLFVRSKYEFLWPIVLCTCGSIYFKVNIEMSIQVKVWNKILPFKFKFRLQ